MAVEIWFRDSFDTEKIEGDLLSLTHHLNVAAANGKKFAILEDAHGRGVMVETENITKAREIADEDAFIG